MRCLIIMPHLSCQNKAIAAMWGTFRATCALLLVSCITEDASEPFVITISDPVIFSFFASFTRLIHLQMPCYFMKRHNWKFSSKQFKEDLCVNEDVSHWLNGAEFKRKYWVSWMTYDRITSAIEHNEVFVKGARGPKQIHVKHQWLGRSSGGSVVVEMNGILISFVEEDRRMFNATVGVPRWSDALFS